MNYFVYGFLYVDCFYFLVGMVVLDWFNVLNCWVKVRVKNVCLWLGV